MQFVLELPTGEKAKAHDILAAIRTLKKVEGDHRAATADEKQALARFGGFGPVALSIFPDPVSGRYKDGWEETGEELRGYPEWHPVHYHCRYRHLRHALVAISAPCANHTKPI